MTDETPQRILEAIPRARWPRALAAILLTGFTKHPDTLLALVLAGEATFLAAAEGSDTFGLTRKEYKTIYKRLCHAATRMGISTRVQ